MNYFAFPMSLIPDRVDGGFVVVFRDLPEAITQGDFLEQCLSEASDCLGEAIAARIDDNLEIPCPSSPQNDEYLVPVPIEIAWKAELYSTMRKRNITVTQLASQLSLDKETVRKLLYPRYQVDVPLVKKALSLLEGNESGSREPKRKLSGQHEVY